MPVIEKNGYERRTLTIFPSIRESEGGVGILEGHAAVFGQRTVIWGAFEESIRSGAFTEALKRNPDVRGLYNHDSNLLLSRTTNGTLVLREDEHGLYTEMDLVDTDIARRVYQWVKTKTVTGMSFAFTVRKAEWTFYDDDPDKMDLREIVEVGDLFDVGPVTYPAYDQTDIGARESQRIYEEARSNYQDHKKILVPSAGLGTTGTDNDAASRGLLFPMSELREKDSIVKYEFKSEEDQAPETVEEPIVEELEELEKDETSETQVEPEAQDAEQTEEHGEASGSEEPKEEGEEEGEPSEGSPADSAEATEPEPEPVEKSGRNPATLRERIKIRRRKVQGS